MRRPTTLRRTTPLDGARVIRPQIQTQPRRVGVGQGANPNSARRVVKADVPVNVPLAHAILPPAHDFLDDYETVKANGRACHRDINDFPLHSYLVEASDGRGFLTKAQDAKQAIAQSGFTNVVRVLDKGIAYIDPLPLPLGEEGEVGAEGVGNGAG